MQEKNASSHYRHFFRIALYVKENLCEAPGIAQNKLTYMNPEIAKYYNGGETQN